MRRKHPPTERLYARLLDTHLRAWLAADDKRTLARFAMILDVAPSQVSRWIHGKRRPNAGIWLELFTQLKLDDRQRAELETALKAPR